jgi:hypothetical protein
MNQKVLFRGKPATRWKPHNKQTREKSQVVMKVQLPVVSNNATTGHKLQGSSVDSIFVHAWIYEKNGLMWSFLVFGLTKDSTYGIH